MSAVNTEISTGLEPIFICGIHKSGTSLVRSLLDGHPQLNIIPLESHFIKHLGFDIEYFFQKQLKKNFEIEKFKNQCLSQINIYNNAPVDNNSDAQISGKINTRLFNELMKEKTSDTSSYQELFKIYSTAILKSIKDHNFHDTKKIVEKSVENAEVAPYYNRLFPNAKFIHIVRNPYSNIVSLRKFKSKQGYPLIMPYIQLLKNNFHYLNRNQELFGDNYMVIKYEDLVTNTKSISSRIADFLNIDYHDSLIRPTSLGQDWSGNSFDKKQKIKGKVQNTKLDKWQKHINPLEVFLINRFLKKNMKEFNYDEYNVSRLSQKYFLPNKGESLKKYLLNRISRSFPI